MPPQIRCRVAFASPPGDPVPKHPPAVLVGPVRSIDRAAALDAPQYRRQLRRGKGANGTLAELGKYVHFNGQMVLLECSSAHPGAAWQTIRARLLRFTSLSGINTGGFLSLHLIWLGARLFQADIRPTAVGVPHRFASRRHFLLPRFRAVDVDVYC